ncbi:MAG: hypothetical protein N3A55_02920 [Methylohalobius sp.]|nr:hypothetical protein [Methylohalobius sp.]
MDPFNRNHIRIAQLSARIILEEGVHDYTLAKRKAAERLRLDWRELPDDQTVEAAIHEYHRIFRFKEQPAFIRRLRQIALEAMELLAEFSPRLAGAVLEGTAGQYQPITLHLFPDTPETVILKLKEAGIPCWEEPHITITALRNEEIPVPVLRLEFRGHPIRALLYPPQALRQTPKRGGRRASIKTLRNLIESENQNEASVNY